MIQASEGSLPFSQVAENRLATAPMAVRSWFFNSLMRPYLSLSLIGLRLIMAIGMAAFLS